MASDEVSESLQSLRSIVVSNLQYQHYWTDIKLLDTPADVSPKDGNVLTSLESLPRPLIHGRPPEQLYNSESALPTESENSSKPTPDMEYVLPVHLSETFTLRKWAAVFNALPTPEEEKKKKRIVVAVVSGDSTVVYYIMHDGIVKPRQN